MLLTAAEPSGLEEEVRFAQRRALGDAAAACAIDPGAPEAWSLFLQALWVSERRRYAQLARGRLDPWLDPKRASFEPPDRLLLPRLQDLSMSTLAPDWFEGFGSPPSEMSR